MPTLLEMVLAAIIMTLGFYAVVYGTWYVLTKGIPWLVGLLRIGKYRKEQTEGNTMVGSARDVFEKR